MNGKETNCKIRFVGFYSLACLKKWRNPEGFEALPIAKHGRYSLSWQNFVGGLNFFRTLLPPEYLPFFYQRNS